MTRLEKAATDGEMEKLDEIIEEIREIKPEVGDGLAALAVDFEYGKILQILEKMNR